MESLLTSLVMLLSGAVFATRRGASLGHIVQDSGIDFKLGWTLSHIIVILTMVILRLFCCSSGFVFAVEQVRDKEHGRVGLLLFLAILVEVVKELVLHARAGELQTFVEF
jgi:hypothetical protein